MNPKPLRWGILGTAGIARKNWAAIRHSGNGVVAAVASRDAARAESFIDQCQAQVPFAERPLAVGSYDALLARPDIDAIYLPLPTSQRPEWVVRAATAGRHVVCEKPCAPDLASLDRMLEACRENRVQFLDGVMFVHGLRMQRLRDLVRDDGPLGEVRRVASQFSFRAPPGFAETNIRARSDLEPQGCAGDLAWYCLRFSLEAFRWADPALVSARTWNVIQAPGGGPVPSEFSGEIDFGDGRTAVFYCSFLAGDQQWAVVSGTRGHLRVDDFVLPFHGNESRLVVQQPEFQVGGCRQVMEGHPTEERFREYSEFHPSAPETRLFRRFAEQVATGELCADWFRHSRQTQSLLDACLASAADDGRPVPMARR